MAKMRMVVFENDADQCLLCVGYYSEGMVSKLFL